MLKKTCKLGTTVTFSCRKGKDVTNTQHNTNIIQKNLTWPKLLPYPLQISFLFFIPIYKIKSTTYIFPVIKHTQFEQITFIHSYVFRITYDMICPLRLIYRYSLDIRHKVVACQYIVRSCM